MSINLLNELDDLVLRSLRTGSSLQFIYQSLYMKAEHLKASEPIVEAIQDSNATNGGKDM